MCSKVDTQMGLGLHPSFGLKGPGQTKPPPGPFQSEDPFAVAFRALEEKQAQTRRSGRARAIKLAHLALVRAGAGAGS